ncbi:hypothetical protein A2165_01205 [Candidatus Curtissbacteria bacterium RBG_13_40_7]|uniref:Uncharacterized protein n=1 Tax=Candidatus Curtissbacteria bacterium RBG_13_40_7 TaxID=1797706 RepID=A0A1F5FVZ8_9BACT|nr:MAG: hypothetical protein A2165_01205 [Candidatus Curtissbacteria bacterium RBG_13_40_7]
MHSEIAFSLRDAFFGSTIPPLTELTDLGTLVSVLLSNAISIAGVVLVFLFILAGFVMVTGSGDPQRLEQGKKIITYGIIGFIVVFVSYYIVLLIETSLGIHILQ